jgi:hypothetical protein
MKEPRIDFLVHPPRTIRCVWLLIWLTCPLTVLAYRPFISTDAAVAEKGITEVELGIVDFAHQRAGNTVASPALRYNYGFATNWEAVLEGALQVLDSGGDHSLRLRDPQLNFKGVLLGGPLQEGRWPISIGLEVGVLLPEPIPGSGFGFQGVLIGSWRTGKCTLHVNAGCGVERDSREPLGLWGIIVERPIGRNLRLGAEVNGQLLRGSTAENSALVGLLWDHGNITYDAGFRFGLTKAAPDVAFTMGLTCRF